LLESLFLDPAGTKILPRWLHRRSQVVSYSDPGGHDYRSTWL